MRILEVAGPDAVVIALGQQIIMHHRQLLSMQVRRSRPKWRVSDPIGEREVYE